ncbi:MAG: glycosyltransferase family 4 protein, partial [Ectothiorhodospiraceae bacterium]|nr:glycosyltransferase family 4 protein [Ectothiorhodospiraceae bacterium]
LLHAHFALPTGLVAEQLSRKFGIPYVLTVHGSDIPGYNPDRFRWHHRMINPLWKRVMVGASEVVSPSKFLASLVRRQINLPIQIIPNGYSREPPGSESSKRPLVLVVSRLFPRKGVQHFLEAIRELDCDWEFVIAGDGPYMPELRALAATVRPNVRFTGFIDQTALHQLYEQARILVFPSIKENFPMVLLEGMSAGCAVITTDADGCAEVVSDAGLVVPAGSPASLKAALLALINDPARCDDLSQRARVRAEQFRWPHIASLYLEAFHGAMRWRPGGAPAGSI